MKFEELEAAWAAQPAPRAAQLDLAELKRAIAPELRRRSRMLGYQVFAIAFGLLVTPLLALVNYRHAPPHDPVLFWVSPAAFLAVYGPVFVHLIRRLQRHRRLRRQRADNLRAVTEIARANLEAEMQEYRLARWLVPFVIALPLLSAYANNPVGVVGWTPLALRALMIFAVVSPAVWIARRHYRVHLAPEHARQTELLRELS